MIAKDSKFDWSIQVTWKRRVIGRAYSLAQQHESCQILQLLSFLNSVGAGGLFSRSRLLLYNFESLFTCRSSSKYVSNSHKKLCTIRRKTPVSESLFNRLLSCQLCETVKNTMFTEHLETPASVFMEHICNIT